MTVNDRQCESIAMFQDARVSIFTNEQRLQFVTSGSIAAQKNRYFVYILFFQELIAQRLQQASSVVQLSSIVNLLRTHAPFIKLNLQSVHYDDTQALSADKLSP